MDLKEAVPVGLGAVLTAMLGGLWAWLTKRAELQRSPPAAITMADAGLTEALGVFVEKLGQSYATHTDKLREEIRERDRVHAAASAAADERIAGLEAKFEECEAHRAECDQAVADLRELVRRLEAGGPIPAYLPGLEPGARR